MPDKAGGIGNQDGITRTRENYIGALLLLNCSFLLLLNT